MTTYLSHSLIHSTNKHFFCTISFQLEAFLNCLEARNRKRVQYENGAVIIDVRRWRQVAAAQQVKGDGIPDRP